VLLAALFPPGTPTWLRFVLEGATLLIAARFLLGAVRRLNIGILVLAAAAWAWFFYPQGHTWMVAEGGRLLADARALLPQLLGRTRTAATAQATALGKSALTISSASASKGA
jgi:hypothetical protein